MTKNIDVDQIFEFTLDLPPLRTRSRVSRGCELRLRSARPPVRLAATKKPKKVFFTHESETLGGTGSVVVGFLGFGLSSLPYFPSRGCELRLRSARPPVRLLCSDSDSTILK